MVDIVFQGIEGVPVCDFDFPITKRNENLHFANDTSEGDISKPGPLC